MKRTLKLKKEILLEQLAIMEEIIAETKTHKEFEEKVITALKLILITSKDN